MRVLLIFILATSGCKTTKPVVSEPEFMTLPQNDPHSWAEMERIWLTERLLVKKVHEKSWDIDYGFARCNRRERKKYRPQVIAALNRAVDLWLSPIEQIQKAINDGRLTSDPIIDHQKPPPELVSDVNIHKKKVTEYRIPPKNKKDKKRKGYTTFNIYAYIKLLKKLKKKLNKIKDPSTIQQHKEFKRFRKFVLNLPEMSVVFVCKEGRSFINLFTNAIVMYEKESKDSIPETNFSFGTLLHEIGHAFGLADTYVDKHNPTRDHMDSTGVHGLTIGHQPFSVMSASGQIFASYKDVKPTVDDKNGISWIYAYMNMNKLKLDTCPLHYQPELFARDERDKPPSIACRPTHPLLFAMASANYSTANVVLADKEASIDINARTHGQGLTAIHYAVLRATPIGLIKAILERFHKEIDFSISGLPKETDFSITGFHQKWTQPLTALELAKIALKNIQQRNQQQLAEHYSAVVELLLRYSRGVT